MPAPTVGIEEEFFLVDAETFAPRDDAEQVLALAGGHDEGLEHELRSAMVETGSAVCSGLEELALDVRSHRAALVRAARTRGALLLASASHPCADAGSVPITSDDRYRRMAEEFGQLAYDSLVCGCHVHVAVPDRERGVAVIDRIRPWLPVLLALSSNSPFWRSEDTGYASWRSQVWQRWPTAGSTGAFGSLEAYEQRTQALIATGAALDEGMLYYDVRLSRTYPTIEVRVADVCLDPEDAVVLAGLVRALVVTALDDDSPLQEHPPELLRAAAWSASRHGSEGPLVDPVSFAARPAADVVGRLLDHTRSALEQLGDAGQVAEGVSRVLQRGSGASAQRRAHERGGLAAVYGRLTLEES